MLPHIPVRTGWLADGMAFPRAGRDLSRIARVGNPGKGRRSVARYLPLLLLASAAGNALIAGQAKAQTAVTLDSSLTVSDGESLTTGTFRIGNSGTGTLAITSTTAAATVTSTNAVIGNGAGSNGTASVTGANSTWTLTSSLSVGVLGRAALNVINGGGISSVGGTVGQGAGSIGTATISGANSRWSTGSVALVVGQSGNGTATVQQGGAVTSTSMTIGQLATGIGSMTVTSAGSKWTLSSGVTIANAGRGTLNISNGGEVTSAGGPIGYANGSIGTVNISSGGKWSIINNAGVTLGSLTGSSAAMTVTGSGSEWNAAGLVVGAAGSATLNIRDSGKVTSQTGAVGSAAGGGGTVNISGGGSWTSAGFTLGSVANATGTVTVSDAGSKWTVTAGLTVGNAGAGTVTVANGGALETANAVLGLNAGSSGTVTLSGGSTWISSAVTLGSSASSLGQATITGAGSKWTQTGGAFTVGSAGTGTISVADGGALDTSSVLLGLNAGGTGTATVSTGGTWTSTSVTLGSVANSSGTVTVSGARSRWTQTSGAFTIGSAGAGTMTVSNGAAIQSANVVLGLNSGGNGTLTLSGGANWTATAAAFGSVANSSGTATVTGAGSSWTVSGGLTVGNGGTGTLTIADYGAVKSAGGVLGASAGGTGTVTLTGGGSWTSTGTVTVGGSGTGVLNFGAAANAPAASAGTFSAPGLMLGTNGTLVFNHTDRAGTYTFDAPITGSATAGTVNVLSGTTTLSGASSWVRTTTISGGTLRLGGSLSSTSLDVTGTAAAGSADAARLDVLAGGTLTSGSGQIGRTAGSSGAVSVSGAGARWSMGTGPLTIGGAGQGSLTITAGGEVSSGVVYLGQLTGGTGTITVSGAGSKLLGTGYFYVGGRRDPATADPLARNGEVLVENGGLIEISPNGSDAYYAQVGNDTGSLATLTVRGTGSVFRTTGKDKGELKIGQLGQGYLFIQDGGRVETSNWATVSGTSTPGTFGVAELTNGASWKLDGDLRIGGGGMGTMAVLGGSVVESVGGTVGRQGTANGSATISGTGSRWSTGSGALFIGEAGVGQVTIAENGALETAGATIGAASTATGSVFLTGGSTWTSSAEIVVGAAGTGTLAITNGGRLSSVGGTLGLETGGTGTVTLTGGGTWTSADGVTIGAAGTGTLNIGAAATTSAAAPGTLTASRVTLGSGGRLVFNHTDRTATFDFAAPLDGTGRLDVLGGTTILSGVGAFSGSTQVSAATLILAGALRDSPVTVGAAGVLAGNGQMGGMQIQSGGMVTPGRSIGTLSVNGNVSFAAGSAYLVEIEPGGAADRIAASGTASLSGGTVMVRPAVGRYLPRIYPILTASGGVTGRFAALDAPTNVSDFLTYGLEYEPFAVNLVLRQTTEFVSVGRTPNQQATAAGIDGLPVGNRVYDTVSLSTVDTARLAFDATSGEIHASAASVAFHDAGLIREAVLSRLREPGPACADTHDLRGKARDIPPCDEWMPDGTPRQFDPRRFGLWGQALGKWGRIGGDGNAAALTSSTGGFVFGADVRPDDETLLGLAAGYTRSSMQVAARGSSGSNETISAAIYAGTQWGAARLRAGAAWSAHGIVTDREIRFPGYSDATHAAYDGATSQLFGEWGYALPLGMAKLEPFVGGSLQRLRTARFAETGGAAALEGASRERQLATTILGLRGEAQLGDKLPLAVRGMLGWQRAWGDVRPSATLSFAGNAPDFLIRAAPIGRDALVGEFGLGWRPGPNLHLGIDYRGQISDGLREHAVKGVFNIQF